MLAVSQTRPKEPPPKSSVSVVTLDELESRETRAIAHLWQKWRGEETMPPRAALLPQQLGRFAPYISLARVVDGGADYEFRVIGDEHTRAYGISFRGGKVGDIISLSPRFGKQLKATYDMVRASARPFAYRGLIGADFPDCRFVWFETAYLPFGTNGTVDHILNAAVYAPKGGKWPG